MSDGEAERSRTVRSTCSGRTTRRRGSACWCSPRPPASGTTRSTRAMRRSSSSVPTNDFQVDHTEDATAFRDAVLSHYDAVVFLSTTGDVLNAAQQTRVRALHPGPVAATPASTPRPTPSTTGSGTATWSAATSSATRPARPSRDRARRGRRRPLDARASPDPVARGSTSGTTTAGRLQEPTPRRRLQPAGQRRPRAAQARRVDLRRGGRQRRWMTTIRSRGARRYDGGRSWYTGMGHTAASFSEADTCSTCSAASRPRPAARHRGLRPAERGPDRAGVGRPEDRQRAAGRGLLGQRLRRGRRPLAYAWDFGDGSTSLPPEPGPHVHAGRHLHGDGDGDGSRRRHRHRDGGDRRGQPAGQPAPTWRRPPTRWPAGRRWRCSSPRPGPIPTATR